jgi:hypothetical protein
VNKYDRRIPERQEVGTPSLEDQSWIAKAVGVRTMKTVVCGKDRGCLIPLTDFEDKISQRIPFLKGKDFEAAFGWGSGNTVCISFSEPIEKIEEGIFLNKPRHEKRRLDVDAKIITEALGVTEKVRDVELRRKIADGKFVNAGPMDLQYNRNELFYFVIFGEPAVFWIKEE